MGHNRSKLANSSKSLPSLKRGQNLPKGVDLQLLPLFDYKGLPLQLGMVPTPYSPAFMVHSPHFLQEQEQPSFAQAFNLFLATIEEALKANMYNYNDLN